MAQYFTDFTGYEVRATIPDWTSRWTTSNEAWSIEWSETSSGKILQHTTTQNIDRFFSWDIGTALDAEILCRFLIGSGAGMNNRQIRLIARGSGDATTKTGYALVMGGWYNFGIDMLLNGAVSQLHAIYFPYTFDPALWAWARFRVSGSNLLAKSWQDGTEEPVDWHININDTQISTSGQFGLGIFNSATTKQFDIFSVGTEGDIARETPGADPISITAAQSDNKIRISWTW